MIKDRPSKTSLNIKKSKKAKKDSKILMNLKLCKTLYLSIVFISRLGNL